MALAYNRLLARLLTMLLNKAPGAAAHNLQRLLADLVGSPVAGWHMGASVQHRERGVPGSINSYLQAARPAIVSTEMSFRKSTRLAFAAHARIMNRISHKI